MLAKDGNKKAKRVLKLVEDPNKFLSTIQVGITFAGFFSSASAATGLSDDLGKVLLNLNIPYGETISLVVVTLILSFFTLVFGELLPKRIALKNPEKIALFAINPVMILMKLFAPFVILLSGTINILLKIFRIKNNKDDGVSKDELQMLIRTGSKEGVIDKTEEKMLNSIFDFKDTKASEIMTPRTNLFMIDINEPVLDNIEKIIQEAYSRVPVYDEDFDDIIGVLYIKELLKEGYEKGFENVDIRKILHRPYFVPEIKKVDDLFIDMKASKNSVALLIDEYGGFSGLVSIEDLIEEVMGDIYDEYDDKEVDVVAIEENKFLIKGNASINKINEKLELNLEESEDYETINGFLTYKLGYIPQEKEKVALDQNNILLTINKAKENKIEEVIIELTND
jgi:putative hemolysin